MSAKFSQRERLLIGKRIYDKEMSISVAALRFCINFYTARDYYRLYKSYVETDPGFEEAFERSLRETQQVLFDAPEEPSGKTRDGDIYMFGPLGDKPGGPGGKEK